MPIKPLPNVQKVPGVQFPELATDYHRTPTLEQWRRDSSVALGVRSSDTLLARVDQIIADYHTPNLDIYVKYQLKADLFFTLDHWLKQHAQAGAGRSGRVPAMQRLYRYAAQSLCDMFQCSVNLLPEYLERHFGRQMGWHGTDLDSRLRMATYLTRAQAEKYRLTFRDGKAYMFTWRGKGTELDGGETRDVGSMKLVLADSRSAANVGVFGNHPDKHNPAVWGGFAMSMGRDLFMARHHCGQGAANPGQGGNFYHSSYLGGAPVLCAGTIVILDGVVRAVANDSGHYRPTSDHFIALLEALRMHGVNLGGVTVFDYAPPQGPGQGHRFLSFNANAFLTARGNWARALLQNVAAGAPRQTAIGLANENARARFQAEMTQHDAPLEALLQRLWLDGLKVGVLQDSDEGRMFFAGTLLPNYMNQAGRNPFITHGVKVSTTWILAALERRFGRPKQPGAGQQHGKLPPAPGGQAQGGGLPPWPQGGGAAPQMPQGGLPPPPPQWNGT